MTRFARVVPACPCAVQEDSATAANGMESVKNFGSQMEPATGAEEEEKKESPFGLYKAQMMFVRVACKIATRHSARLGTVKIKFLISHSAGREEA